jgi:hypothetical protein
MFTMQRENTAIMKETFFSDQLAVAVRDLLGFGSCELLVLEAGS